MKVASAVAKILKQEGVEFLIGYPANPLFEAAAEEDIRPIISRQERTGMHMADAVSRMSSGDRIGVFAMQFGPGSENAFGSVAQAYAESVPVVVLPAGYARTMSSVAPQFSSYLNYQHITKSAELVSLKSVAPDALRRAFTQVRNGRPGPALVELPYDLLEEEYGDAVDYRTSVSARTAPDPAAVAEAARLLSSAERPVIYAGQGVHYAKAWDQLLQLAELLEAPVTTSLAGKSAFPETHQLSLGSGGRATPRPVDHFLKRADVIFGIGCSFTKTNYGIQFPAGKTVIHATLDPLDLNKDVPVTLPLLGDAALTLEALIEAFQSGQNWQSPNRLESVASEIEEVRNSWLADWMPKLTSSQVPLTPYRVIWDLLQTVDVSQTIITHDAGSPRDQLSPFWSTVAPLSYIGWGKSTQLGYGLGLAMGAKLIHPDKLCINVWGDAAIGMTGMDFETAVRERLPILSILFNNFTMAIELSTMEVATEKFNTTGLSGNYADMARAFGGYGERITTPDEIIPAIRRGIEQTESGTPALLEFITCQETDYSLPK